MTDTQPGGAATLRAAAAYLDEVRAAAEQLAQGETRRLVACRAAYAAGIDRAEIAKAAGMTRDGLYKLLRRSRSQ